jgi:uncharacterized protein (TIGR02466 family)
MPARAYFPTLIYTARLGGARGRTLQRRLLRECMQLRLDDSAGRTWSARNYPGGYTSYNSVSRLHQLSPTFAQLEREISRHVRAYAKALDFDLTGRELTMTDCWANIMPRRVVHTLHLHPHATISGTYYVQTPPGAACLKFEDPRLDRFMAAPPRKSNAREYNRTWIELPAQAGQLVLFESWLRHEVPPNTSTRERISVSFNYNWF